MKRILSVAGGLCPQVMTEDRYTLHQSGRTVDAPHSGFYRITKGRYTPSACSRASANRRTCC